MKKITLLLIFHLSFLIFNSQKVKAQWVTIPDANFVTWLTTNYPACMNGNQMDTTCAPIVGAATVFVPNQNISNLSGIEYFDNLQQLNCYYNQLSSLPALPNSLSILDCSSNQLTSLPALPNTLTELICSDNQLTHLLTLPNSLTKLWCSFNQLTSLPSLPISLTNLICENNQLTSLPTLPNTLSTLRIGYNQLTSLPTLSSSLTYLDCYSNQLINLPALPNSLTQIKCGNNQLTSIPQLSNSLTDLWCENNQLTSLPTLPDSLYMLICEHNQLVSLPALPNSLHTLQSGYNQLSSLPALPDSLISLICYYNQLTSLPILPNTLQALYCNNNQLNSVPQLPIGIHWFYIDSNNISCIANLPYIQYSSWANISSNPLTCVPNQTNYSLGLPLCTDNDPINNPNNCQSHVNIYGNVYKDLNSNCTYNTTDLQSQNIPVKLYDTQNNLLAMNYTINGIYGFATLQPDSFIVKIDDVDLPINMACGVASNQTVSLFSTNQTIANINFPVVCDTTYDVNLQSVTRQGWVFPGQVHTINTNITNNETWYNLNCGSTIYSGTVTININGPITYVAPAVGALTPIVSGNNFTYNINNFDSITPTSFGLKLLTDTSAQAGQQICVHVSIATTPTDADTSNNEYTFCYNVVNSYDPNMKEVYPVNVLPGYNDWFTYTIHFQNTGTAPAFNIRLRDTLDTQLDINTFEFLGASHTATTSLNGRNLSVRFNNIMLPDSTSNYDGSMGYYQYRIKPLQNLPNGSNIKNTAYIYFDYNPAIVTNTTQNNFDIFTTAPSPLGRAGVGLFYPNPSSGNFYYKNLPKNSTITIYNILGEVCLTHYASLPFGEVGGAALPKGIYYCKVNGSFVVKLVKE